MGKRCDSPLAERNCKFFKGPPREEEDLGIQALSVGNKWKITLRSVTWERASCFCTRRRTRGEEEETGLLYQSIVNACYSVPAPSLFL